MSNQTRTRTKVQDEAEKVPEPVLCDNQDGKPATLITNGGGKHSTIRLCRACTPRHMR